MLDMGGSVQEQGRKMWPRLPEKIQENIGQKFIQSDSFQP
jgi:hypothetical protein